ncbi:MAG: DUF1289 domain-containing protein [Gammaproteobacteria bacterium]
MENSVKTNASVIDSPCTGICELGPGGFCSGCFRHIDEIVAWGGLSNAERELILAELPDRRTPRDSTQYNEEPERTGGDTE